MVIYADGQRFKYVDFERIRDADYVGVWARIAHLRITLRSRPGYVSPEVHGLRVMFADLAAVGRCRRG